MGRVKLCTRHRQMNYFCGYSCSSSARSSFLGECSRAVHRRRRGNVNTNRDAALSRAHQNLDLLPSSPQIRIILCVCGACESTIKISNVGARAELNSLPPFALWHLAQNIPTPPCPASKLCLADFPLFHQILTWSGAPGTGDEHLMRTAVM